MPSASNASLMSCLTAYLQLVEQISEKQQRLAPFFEASHQAMQCHEKSMLRPYATQELKETLLALAQQPSTKTHLPFNDIQTFFYLARTHKTPKRSMYASLYLLLDDKQYTLRLKQGNDKHFHHQATHIQAPDEDMLHSWMNHLWQEPFGN